MTTATSEELRFAERTNTSVLVGLFCALVGLSVPAIAFGLLGLFEADRRPHETGSWIGWTAVMLGVVELAATIAIAVSMLT
ncbi:hypothetical protein [Rhodococcus tukisamuensis]|uniref:DUF4190 domain-containing protein n=1 Tax=Rhodococcus tukisamuensis TaxID=168276 RepID=A0A1G7DHW2_9NOCA|nr:hypothetical protein [Rhodococcus tukisamuensis]SDE50385.1 hypothetical protein SAMN05444580_11929 [Rhodococcus tukisamuensis]